MDKEYDAEKDIEKICKKYKMVFTNPVEYESIERTEMLPMLHSKLIEFVEKEKYGFHVLFVDYGKHKLHITINREATEVGNIDDLEDASEFFTRKGQAKQFGKIQPLFYDKSGNFWLWNSELKCWERVDDVDVLNMIDERTGKDVISSKARTEILNSLKQEGRKRIPKPIKKTWIQFKDVFYDIKTGEEIEAIPDYFATNPIPYELHKKKYRETPTIDKIFEEWVGKNKIQTLYEIISYCLLPDYPIHRLFCFIGEGMNGKTCFLRLLRKFIGEKNITSTELDTLLNSRFEVTRLYKKLVCVMGETNFAEINKTSIIKKLTGQDVVGFEYKNKDLFDDVNYAKVIIATNNLPATTDKTIGFYRRWLIIDFPNRFSEEQDILKTIPEEEYQCLALKCAMILKDLLGKRKFHNEGTVEERMRKYEDMSNPFEKFWKDNIEENGNSFIWKHEFRDRLKDWCREHRFRELTDHNISKEMKIRHIETQQRTADFPDKYGNRPKWRSWTGINWKTTPMEQESQLSQDISTSLHMGIKLDSPVTPVTPVLCTEEKVDGQAKNKVKPTEPTKTS